MPVRTTVKLPSGDSVPALGQGTWKMGEDRRRHADEVAALKLGIDLGLTLIDTAEMYASGGAEPVVAEAIAGRRDEVFIVSKVLPSNASRRGVEAACEQQPEAAAHRTRSTSTCCTGAARVPLAETVDAFEALKRARQDPALGRQQFRHRRHGRAGGLAGGQAPSQTNQVLYNPTPRGIEHDLIPWCRPRHPDHGLFAGRAGQAARDARLEARCPQARCDGRADRARLGDAPSTA